MFFDLPLEELETYRPARSEADDFDAFWARTLEEARRFPLDVVFEPVDFGLATVETYDVTFRGFGGHPIKGWFMLPRQRSGPLPCVVEYIGYGGGRGNPYFWLLWSAAGYAHLVMDTRGQGSMWVPGDTPDPAAESGDPHCPGFMTQGVLSPETYFYRRVFTDAVRAAEAARDHPAVDAGRVAVTGGSQGGGITLAVSGLEPTVAAAMPDVPFLCHYQRAVSISDAAPYNEIVQYCKVHRDKSEQVFQTLSYFDGVNLAARATTPAFFSVGLMDVICPPSTVFAAYNHYAGPKEIQVWPYNGHEGGEIFQKRRQVEFLQRLWS